MYVPTIGLEIHAELKTKTKMFCNSKNDPDESKPNVNVCPVCMAHPGTLPVINREAVRYVLMVGVALQGKLADYTEFDRKNYFYPDLPKGYQISQYEFPLVSGGRLNDVAITRVHLEEDTASSIHDEESGSTIIDFNRAGVPLMELVTEPVITSAKQAGDFARELQLLLRYLGVSNANMEKGEMRVEANISLQKAESSKQGRLGTKVEIKNLNSFRAMEKAVEYEIKRQTKLLEKGEKVVQETRGWDERKQETFSQRTKEGSADYRYFPDPDLPSVRIAEIEEFSIERLEGAMPELPWQRRDRYIELGAKTEDAEMFVRNPGFGSLFDAAVKGFSKRGKEVVLAANFIANNIAGLLGEQSNRDIDERDAEFNADMPMNPKHLRELIDMVASGEITSQAAKEILPEAVMESRNPREVAKERGLFVRPTEAVDKVIGKVLRENERAVRQYKAGKLATLQFLVGQAMRELRGHDPQKIRKVLEKRLSETLAV